MKPPLASVPSKDIQFAIDPSILAAPGEGAPFLQTICLTHENTTIAQARWMAQSDVAEGVVQVLEFWVAPPHGRKGHGTRLMGELTRQARSFFKARKSALRRMWLAIDQKRHVIARSFLMKFTFHHVGTVREMLRDEDLLIYMRTFD